MIQVRNLHKMQGSKIVLEGASFVITEGQKIGLVGPNGTGKTTLLEIILGFQEEDGGEVIVAKEKIGYLPQKISYEKTETVGEYAKHVLDNHWEYHKIRDALHTVGLESISEDHLVDHLSGGQKTRLGIARVLLSNPTTILMDEPTNNLDLSGLAWLEEVIHDFKGTVFVISHDRAFLDNTVERIFELDPFKHTINEYKGGYTDFALERAARIKREIAEYERFEKKRKKMEEWIALKRQQLSVYVNPKVGAQLQAMKTRYKRDFENSDIEKPKEYKKMQLGDVSGSVHGAKLIFKAHRARKEGIVICDELMVHGNDRLLLEGSNGSGKTTFIRMLLGKETGMVGEVRQGENLKVGLFTQEHEMLDPDNSVIDELVDKTQVSDEPSARKLLGRFLLFGQKVYAKVSTLSEGEKVKLIMAILTNQGNEFLILDEPTNHLDIESREILEAALAEYAGGFIVVSHDRYFVERIGVNRTLSINSNNRVIETYE